VGLAGGADLLDGGFGEEFELTVAEDFEVVGVEGDAVVILWLEAEDFSGDVLDGEEEFTVAGEEKRGVGAGEFDGDVRLGGGSGRDRKGSASGAAGGRLHLAVAGKDVGLKVQTANRGEGLEKVCNLFFCVARIVHHALLSGRRRN
jgi:hypothetical protein